MIERKRKPGAGAKPKAERGEIIVRDKPISIYPKEKYLSVFDRDEMISICKSALESHFELKIRESQA